MGKSAPSAPDPYGVAQAQGQVNYDTARSQASLNRLNTFTPFGNITYRQAPGTQSFEDFFNSRQAQREQDPTYQAQVAQMGAGWRDANLREFQNVLRREYDAGPGREQIVMELSPEQRRLYDQGVQLSEGTNRLAIDMLPQAREALLQPMAMDDPDARDRATNAILSRLEPQFTRDREALEGRLLSQGFQPGTEAYRQAADELNRSSTDARMQAVLAGLGESRAAAGFNNAVRGQRIGELGALFGVGPQMQMPQQMNVPQVGLNAPDLSSNIYANYNARMADRQATNALYAQLLGSAARAGGSYAGGR